jgi:asparagine synthase (glutamine-hydrolysing)
MCGICGSANFRKDSEINLEEAVKLLKHRGPDDHGIFVKYPVSLGHTRLAIQDSANAKQPMLSSSGRHVIVFNGEIYNHFDLRSLVPNHSWRTKSDTETVVELFELIGQKVFDEFIGMFAFGIWNLEKLSLLLARDVNGEKPLFYNFNSGGISFSSEAKVVCCLLGNQQTIEIKKLPYFLKYGYFNPKESFVEGILPVLPGEVVSWAEGKLTLTNKIGAGKASPGSFEKPRTAREVIRTAVHRTLLSDNSVGIMLSGGIDSSIIAALASENSPGLPTFTVSLTKDSQDAKYARLIAKEIKSDHYEITINPTTLADDIEEIITGLPQPLADSAIIPTNLLSRFASSKVKVLLSGDGADEVFAGYGYYEKYKDLKNTYKIESYAREVIFHLLKKTRYKKINQLRDEFSKSKVTSKRLNYQEAWNQDLAAFTDSELGEMLGIKNFTEAKGILKYDGNSPEFWDVIRADREYYLAGNILQKSDLGGMLASIEIRAPYLDRDLDRYLSENIRDPKMLNKKILHEAFADMVPQEIFIRKKQGFGAPLDLWFENERVRKLIDSTLLNRESVVYKHFDYDKSVRYVKKSNLKCWNFFVLALWLNNNAK